MSKFIFGAASFLFGLRLIKPPALGFEGYFYVFRETFEKYGDQTPEGLMQVRIRNIVLTKKVEGEEPIEY